jgi:AcrR family transcriptional regulator
MAESTNLDALYTQSLQHSDLTAKQQAILQAALDLFADQGFDHTTTKDIAQRAGVAEGTVYKRYKTKDELLAAVLAPFATDVVPHAADEFIGARLSGRPANLHDYLKAIVDDRFEFVAKNFKYVKIVFERALADNDFRQRMISSIAPRVMGPLFKTVSYLRDQGLMADMPTDMLAQFMISTLFGFAFRIMVVDEPVDLDKQKTIVLRFLENGLRPQA